MHDLPSILILNERDPAHPRAGGAEIHVEQIFSRLVERGHRVHQLSTGFRGAPQEEQRRGIRIERRGPLAAYYATLPLRLRRAVRRHAVDVVVECLNKLPFYAPLHAPVPVLALCHHLFGEVAFDQVAWPIAAAVRAAELGLPRAYQDVEFLAISESTRADLIARGLPGPTIHVSPPGIDPPRIAVDPARSRPVRIAYVGRLESYKQIELMLEAAARLAARHPDLEVFVIGRGSERARLESRAARLGLEARTTFTGFVTDAERDRLLAHTRVCVFPSRKEGWGLTVIEANALGTPVVALDAPGLRDSIRHEQTGLLVGSASPADFASAIERLLGETDETIAMRRSAIAWASRFDWERAADDMQVAIDRARSRHRRRAA
ncbi:MAG TPA: glycosyltransferase family 4 protein [Myxococcota bacterium]|nr:glycosyltransferase family 4 protein [Myxococcota bacterium]